MELDAKIFVAGHQGMVGSAIVRALEAQGYKNIIKRTLNELDLTRQTDTETFFQTEKPEFVFLAAARVGGIYANNTWPADFIYQNLMIQANVIHAAWQSGVKKLLFLGSSCIYPKFADQPINEEALLTGLLEPTNEAYAIAKISGIELCKFYRHQYGADFISAMPTNLYGIGDNFDLQTSHVLPALIRKFHEAKQQGDKQVVMWGTGTPRREFLYVDDLADACLYLMRNYSDPLHINVGTGQDIEIGELAALVKRIVGFEGEIVNDLTKPDGTPRKLLDVGRLHALGWQHQTELEDGIRRAYDWFASNDSTTS